MKVVVFALPFEAAGFRPIAGEAGVWVMGAAGALAAKSFEERLAVSAQPEMVISAGLAGALVPELSVGNIVVGENSCDGFLRKLSKSPESSWRKGKIHTLDSIAATGREKVDLGNQTGAMVCEMESARVEGICHRAGIPFAAVRSVSDTVDFDMPVPSGYLADPQTGKPNISGLLGSLFARPTRVPAFIRMIRDASFARGTLHRFLSGLE